MPRRTSLLLTSALLAAVCHVAPAQAQLSRTFVSAGAGNDASDCNRATPCRTLQGAHDKTNADGEITVLDAGGYGALTITKAIAIVNDGVGEASVLVSGGASGITINAPAGASVSLRGITVQGIGFGGGRGLVFNSGASLTIAGCVFRNHSAEGIVFRPNAAGTFNLAVVGTTVADNGGDGVVILPTTTDEILRVAVDHVYMLHNGDSGMRVDGTFGAGRITASVTNSVSANNGAYGFHVTTGANMTNNVSLIRSTSANNNLAGARVANGPTARLRIGRSSITDNTATFVLDGGSVQSFGDNHIVGNGDGDPAPPTIVTK